MKVVLLKKQTELPIDKVRMQRTIPTEGGYGNEEPSRTDSFWSNPAFS